MMVLLGILNGILISTPFCFGHPGEIGAISLIFAAIIGGFIGFKRRKSVGFFYFMIIAALILASIISNNLLSTP